MENFIRNNGWRNNFSRRPVLAQSLFENCILFLIAAVYFMANMQCSEHTTPNSPEARLQVEILARRPDLMVAVRELTV